MMHLHLPQAPRCECTSRSSRISRRRNSITRSSHVLRSSACKLRGGVKPRRLRRPRQATLLNEYIDVH
jgi:hypothetical protein